MAPTRRNPAKSDDPIVPRGNEEPKTNGSSASAEDSSVAPEVPTPVLINFVACTIALVILPIGSYFLSLHSIFNGNNIYSAILAAIVANIVLAAFVVQALREDRADKRQDKPEGKKER